MRAMVLKQSRRPLEHLEFPDPTPGAGEIRIKVAACGVCRTDLHVVDGELPHPKLPIIPGHEIVGRVDAIGPGVENFVLGERVGVPWLGHTCGSCSFCMGGQENLCDYPLFTGYTRDGGFATATIADARYTFRLGERGTDVELAPLLCAGLIGWRSLTIAGTGKKLGLYGFGAAAHIVAQIAKWQGRTVFAFTKPGDAAAQEFARSLGAAWAGDFEPGGARAARRGDHLRASWRIDTARLEGPPQRRQSCLRRHSHERHSPISVFASLGRAAACFGGQSNAAGWIELLRCRAEGWYQDEHRAIPAREREPSTRRLASGALRGRRCPGALRENPGNRRAGEAHSLGTVLTSTVIQARARSTRRRRKSDRCRSTDQSPKVPRPAIAQERARQAPA